MSRILANYREPLGWRNFVPLLPFCLLPLTMVGFAARPALDYGVMTEEVLEAQRRGEEANSHAQYLEGFGAGGPPTEDVRRIEQLLIEQLPSSFESTEFLASCLKASEGIEFEIDAILPEGSTDLKLAVSGRSIHEQLCSIHGRGDLAALDAFLAALHRCGHPVALHRCQLSANPTQPGVSEFTLRLGVYFLAVPAQADLSPELDH